MTSIEFRRVTKTYRSDQGPVQVLQDLSFRVERGEFCAIVGPTGCGKTTILNLLAGFITPDAGEVVANGLAVEEPGRDRAMVFQSDALFPWLDVYRNVGYGLVTAGVSIGQRDATLRRFLEAMGLRDVAHKYPKNLSGGERKRADLARAFICGGPIVLCDEPFAQVDPLTADVLHLFIAELWQETGKTILFTTHNLEEALFLADRILVLSPRPARIMRVVDVPFKRPRVLDLKTSAELQFLRAQLRREFDQSINGVSTSKESP